MRKKATNKKRIYEPLTLGQAVVVKTSFFCSKKIHDFLYIGIYVTFKCANIDYIKKAYNHMIEIEDGLRIKCVFHNGFKQYFENYTYEDIPVVELQDQNLLYKTMKENKKLNNPYSGGEVRKAIIYTVKGSDEATLFMVFDHVCFDGYSIGLVYRNITKYYNDLKNNKELQFPMKRYSYQDYINDYKKFRYSKAYKENIKYFKNKLNKDKDFSLIDGSISCTSEVSLYEITFEDVLYKKALSFSKQVYVPIHFVLLAILAICNYKVTGKNNCPLYFMAHGRTNFLSKNTIGAMVKTFMFYFHVREDETFVDYLKRSFLEYLDAYKHSGFTPLDTILPTLKTAARVKSVNYYNNLISCLDIDNVSGDDNFEYGSIMHSYQNYKTYTLISCGDNKVNIKVSYQGKVITKEFLEKLGEEVSYYLASVELEDKIL